MKQLKAAMIVTAMGVALGGHVANAATLLTAPAFALNETMYCDAVNTTTKPVTVLITALGSGGFEWDSLSVTLQPGQAASVSGNDNGYCKFVVTGSKRKVAAMAVYSRNDNSHYTAVLPAQ